MNLFFRFLGAVCLLLGSFGIAYCRVEHFERDYEIVSESERVLTKIRQKILYQRLPIDRLLFELSEEMSGEWKHFFKEALEKKNLDREDFGEAFGAYIKEFCEKHELEEEQYLFCGIRTLLQAYDTEEIDAEIQLLLEEQRLRRKDLTQKRDGNKKMSYVLGLAGGVTGILILL